jgi:hypothetical protein
MGGVGVGVDICGPFRRIIIDWLTFIKLFNAAWSNAHSLAAILWLTIAQMLIIIIIVMEAVSNIIFQDLVTLHAASVDL